ncbi:type II toxin-antitoxin system RelB/DinJ family antitoxin [Methylobacterium sp. J-030]|uniref:type II toxin-antitoxin system RelB/DinJ family antitoxin n=1 Tax=Methylobacterium sp. J-030 TaxID=2836627 RepID=UPI001FB87016|nr:type II toxin-antitoxin system RelB/DinJ family antitoxin [Methylobacterium sp. J-030]
MIETDVDPVTQEEAAAVLADLGLTVSDAVRLLLMRVAREKALPFEPLAPNETTIDAMREARPESLPRFDDVAALMAAVKTDD